MLETSSLKSFDDWELNYAERLLSWLLCKKKLLWRLRMR